MSAVLFLFTATCRPAGFLQICIKRALKSRMSLGVCCHHHKEFAGAGLCWSLSAFRCSQDILLLSRLSLAGISDICPHHWCGTLEQLVMLLFELEIKYRYQCLRSWFMDLQFLGHFALLQWVFWGETQSAFHPWASVILIALMTSWPMVWWITCFLLAGCWVSCSQRGWKEMGDLSAQTFSGGQVMPDLASQ